MLKRMMATCKGAARDRRGVSSLEYAVLGSMIAAAIGLAVAAVGRTTGVNFQMAVAALSGGTVASANGSTPPATGGGNGGS